MAGSELQGAITASNVILVPERGHTDVPQAIWKQLEAVPDFRRIVEKGILSATLLPERGVRLEGSCYVGRVQCGEVRLELREKVDGALVSLLRHATRDAFRMERATAPASELGDLAALLAQQFISSVNAYTSRGRNFEYTIKRQTGSLVGGRIDITRSVQLRARGFGHLLVFDKNTVSHNTAINRVVLAALREVERLSRLVNIKTEDIARARGLAMLFSDCRDAEVLFGGRSRFIDQAQALLGTTLPPNIRDMLALAGVVLSHESFEHSRETSMSVPRSWFLNLESLFETAVRNVLADTLLKSYQVSRGGKHGRRVFDRLSAEFSAHPDLVLTEEGIPVAVGDVKYKSWEASAAASDVYQLLVHAAVFQCDRAFLVYPSDRYAFRKLGRAATGAEVFLFAVDLRSLRTSIELLSKKLGLCHTRTDHTPAPQLATANT